MELTRRDALAALAFAGVTTGCLEPEDAPRDVVDGLSQVAEAIYPSEVEATGEFVETYVVGRLEGREGYLDGVRTTLSDLDDASHELEDAELSDLSPDEISGLLRRLGADEADPVPDGTLAERLRFHVVNELQYALYTTPVGGRLVGIENPVGHPGGLSSYRREDTR